MYCYFVYLTLAFYRMGMKYSEIMKQWTSVSRAALRFLSACLITYYVCDCVIYVYPYTMLYILHKDCWSHYPTIQQGILTFMWSVCFLKAILLPMIINKLAYRMQQL